jgi:hypothetical protein
MLRSAQMLLRSVLLLHTLLIIITTQNVPMEISINQKFTHTGQYDVQSRILNTTQPLASFNVPYNRTFQENPGIAILSIDRI